MSENRYNAFAPWAKRTPENWVMKRLKYAASLISEKIEAGTTGLRYIGLEHVEPWTGRLIEATEGEGGADGLSSRFRPDDVLFGKLRPYLAKVHRAEQNGVCSGELLVLRPTLLDSRYLNYFLLMNEFIGAVDASTYGSKMPRANWEFIGNLPILVPSLNEQRMIADFLDRETAKVGDLVDCKSTLLRQLDDREQSLITSTVCRGLNASAPTRATGVRWIGDVPEHWELLHLRRVVKKFVDYRGRTPEKVPSGVPLVTAVNIKNGRIDLSLGQEFMPEADYDEWMVRGLPERGDLLVTTEAPLGEVAQIEDTRVALAQRIILLKVKKEKISNEYLKYFFRSAAGQGELWTRASGSTALGIKASRFKGITVIVPPLSEQSAIVDHLNRETSRLEQLKRTVEQSLPRLSEYRSALISAAVTGQIDVRNYRRQEAAALCQ